jgi:hypothetical protein
MMQSAWIPNHRALATWARGWVRRLLEDLEAYHPHYREARVIERLEHGAPPGRYPLAQHQLDAAIGWLKLAHDASRGGGVSWGYRARRAFGSADALGWVAAYPETTGYIIPTLLRYAQLTSDEDSRRRARQLTDWELSIQLSDGGFQGGIVGAPGIAESSTFVTGQVLFGLLASYSSFADERYLRAAIRAGDCLVRCLDGEGRFTKGFSRYCAPGPKVYEVRTGMALAELGLLTGRVDYQQAALRIAAYARSQQRANGWFAENDLNDHSRPLTHTIGYALEGLEGIGIALSQSDCLSAVERTLDALLHIVPPDGTLPGRLLDDWAPAVTWTCLTGNAQIAGVFLRSYARHGVAAYLHAGERLLGLVAFTQSIRGTSLALRGGIRGSYPFGGDYGRWCVLNWATKFFADSLMDCLPLSSSIQQ